MNNRMTRERERMVLEYARMELAITKIQSNMDYIGNIKPITIATDE